MQPIIEYIISNSSLLQKISFIFKNPFKYNQLIDIAINLAKKNKKNYDEFIKMVKDELNYNNNLKILHPHLISFAIHDHHQTLFKFLFDNFFCLNEDFTSIIKIERSDLQLYILIDIILQLSESDQIYLLKEMILYGYINKLIFEDILIPIKQQLFNLCFYFIIHLKKWNIKRVKRISKNLYILFSTIESYSINKSINQDYLQSHLHIHNWFERIKQNPYKLNEFYSKTIPENLSKYIFSIEDDIKRYEYIKRIRTAQLFLQAKKQTNLNTLIHQSHF